MTPLVKRRIRDNLHGSIDLNSLEDKIISHPYFQRLRRVKQTAFLSFAFPGATHTRFEHSLGCMHLAGRAWKKILSNQERLKYKASKIPSDSNYPLEKLSPGEASLSSTFPFLEKIANSEYAYQVLRLAALFHDVGHPPLSHTGEIFLPTQKEFLENNKNIPDYLRKQLEEKDQEKRVSHETYSILILDKILKDTYEDGVKGDSLLINPQDIASVVSQLETLYDGGDRQPIVRLYEGSDGVRQILEDVLASVEATAHREYFVYSSSAVRNAGLYVGYPDYTKDRIAKGIELKNISFGKSGKTSGLDERRHIASDAGAPTYVLLCAGKVANIFLDGRGEFMGLIIDNRAMYETQRVLFMELWDRLPS